VSRLRTAFVAPPVAVIALLVACTNAAAVVNVPVPPPSTFAAVEGESFTGVVAHFSGVTFTPTGATITWGDGRSTGVRPVRTAPGEYDVGATHTYAEEGDYTAAVTLFYSGGGTAQVVTAIVGDAALHGSGVSPNAIRAQPGEAFTGVQLASFTDDNPAAGVSDYSATIDWGDGTTSVGAIVSNGVGGWNVLGDHTYASECSCEIQVTGSDDGGATFVAYIGAYVAAPPPPSPGPQPPARNAIDFALDAGNQPDLGGPGCRTHVEHENGLTIVYGFLPVNVSLRGAPPRRRSGSSGWRVRAGRSRSRFLPSGACSRGS
jgi:hypothetical protein